MTTKSKTNNRRKAKNRLTELRLAGVVLSQDQVGTLIGCDGATVSRHETGERSMTKDQIAKYAALYGVPTHELFFVAPIVEPDDLSNDGMHVVNE